MEGQVPETIKASRSNELLLLDGEMSGRYREGFLHKETEVLFEEEKVIGGRRCQIGHTKEYRRAAFETEENLSGQILTGGLIGFLEADILLFKPQMH